MSDNIDLSMYECIMHELKYIPITYTRQALYSISYILYIALYNYTANNVD